MCKFTPLLLVLLIAGCPKPDVRPPLRVIELREAIAVANANAARLPGCLKADGFASGHFQDASGKRRPVDLDAGMQIIPPMHLYLTLKSGLGSQEMLIGSNEDMYWSHVQRDNDSYRYGRHIALNDVPMRQIPYRPDWLIEALGLNRLPYDTSGPTGPVQRIEQDHQQVIFLDDDGRGQQVIHKEYWLERHDKRLVRRIIFRDAMGRIAMDSRLEDYEPFGDDGLLLPQRFKVEWPLADAALDLRIDKWSALQRTRDHDAFQPPHVRGESYTRMINLDETRRID